MNSNDAVLEAFARAFLGAPDVVTRAPGRVNLIGEHTDYNDGFVLPMAINYDVRLAARARPDRLVRLYSAAFDDADVFHLDDVRHSTIAWSQYLRGVVDILQREGYTLRGMDAAIYGNIPIGAGLSSSAALELAAITAFRYLNGLDSATATGQALDRVQAALLCQRAENEFVGVKCGIMDQFVSSLGQANSALLIDCRSLDHSLVPLPHGVSIVVVDSGLRRDLVDSAYNERRLQCEEGARLLGVPALRDATPTVLAAKENKLPEVVARRCRHVVAENRRVLDGALALRNGDLATFGTLMAESHASLRDLFEVSTPEIDALVEVQQEVAGCLGARLTGAGFGGCTVALVRDHALIELLNTIRVEYPARTGQTPKAYVCRAADGATVVSV